jgi:opacity protein-like surface antigen
MTRSISAALAFALALSAITAASAANHMNRASKTTAASDTLTLSDAQHASIWNDVSRHASNQNAPDGFNATVGEAVPSQLTTKPLPRQARRDVPEVRPYRYAMTEDKLLIVNPSDHKIADVVAKPQQ